MAISSLSCVLPPLFPAPVLVICFARSLLPASGRGADKQNRSLITPSTLDQLPSGHNLLLSIPESHNPQPFLLDPKAAYLFGPGVSLLADRQNVKQEGRTAGLEHEGRSSRPKVTEKVYGFWVDKGHGVIVSSHFISISSVRSCRLQ